MNEIFERIKAFNVWNGQLYNAGYLRTEYLNVVTKFIGNKLVKVLIGQRRVGKSYVLRQIINHLISDKGVNPQNIFYVNKEYTAFDGINSSVDLEDIFNYYRSMFELNGKIYILLDEVQNIHNWEKFVNSYSQDFTSEYEIFITGSNSNLLSGELATLLSGRYVEFEVFPFSLFEYAAFKNLNINKETFFAYMKTGGMPEMLNFDQDELQRHYIESLRNTIVLRDIVGRQNIKDLALLEDIFKFLSSNIGNLTSISRIINYFKSRQKKTNYETVSSYVEFLVNTFMIHKAERYNLRGKQTLGGECKYYLNDLSFKNFILGYFPADVGNNLENYIFIQLKRMGYKVSAGVFNDIEIDFVAQKPAKTMYIQVCYILNEEKTIQREFGNLLLIKDNYEKIVVSLDDFKFSDYEGIKHIRPWELV